MTIKKQLIGTNKIANSISAESVSFTRVESSSDAEKEMLFRRNFKKFNAEKISDRVSFLSDKLNLKLDHISGKPIEPKIWRSNIENFIGYAQIPIGILGPLSIEGKSATGKYYIPLATTEGAIVTAYSSGAELIGENGGCRASSKDNGVHITPAFFVNNGEEAILLSKWIDSNRREIIKVAESTTSHGKVKEIKPFQSGLTLCVTFVFSTEDALGLNMINIASEKACEYISQATGFKYSIRSNHSSDKKISTHQLSGTIGKEASAEVTLSKESLEERGSSAKAMFDIWKLGYTSCARSNMQGINAQGPNAIAGLFVACGQDVAELASSSVCFDEVDINSNGDLFFRVFLPSLSIATVGGGTQKGTALECLKLLGCDGSGKVLKFAEIIAATVLAGEIATLLAVTTGNFVSAHRLYGR